MKNAVAVVVAWVACMLGWVGSARADESKYCDNVPPSAASAGKVCRFVVKYEDNLAISSEEVKGLKDFENRLYLDYTAAEVWNQLNAERKARGLAEIPKKDRRSCAWSCDPLPADAETCGDYNFELQSQDGGGKTVKTGSSSDSGIEFGGLGGVLEQHCLDEAKKQFSSKQQGQGQKAGKAKGAEQDFSKKRVFAKLAKANGSGHFVEVKAGAKAKAKPGVTIAVWTSTDGKQSQALIAGVAGVSECVVVDASGNKSTAITPKALGAAFVAELPAGTKLAGPAKLELEAAGKSFAFARPQKPKSGK